MDSPYANGAYSPPYPHYASLAQARGFYCSGPARSPYPTEPTGLYRPPSPAPGWSFIPPECPSEGSALRRQHQVPGYSPPQVRALPALGGSWQRGWGRGRQLLSTLSCLLLLLKIWWAPCSLSLSFWAGKAGIGQPT